MFYPGGNQQPSHIVPFTPGQQGQFPPISGYTSQTPYVVQQTPQNAYGQQNPTFMPVSINSPSANQGYAGVAGISRYTPSNGYYEPQTVPQAQPQQQQQQQAQPTYRQNKNQYEPVPSDDERYRKQLIVNYLAPDVTGTELHTLFSRFGPLDGARVIVDRQTNMPRGFGFVYYRYAEGAKEAVEKMNGYEYHGKRLKVGYSTNPLNIISTTPGMPSEQDPMN